MVFIEILNAQNDINQVKQMFKEYVEWLNIDLSFQNFDEEFNSLPGKYSMENDGRLYIAKCDGKLAGCIALRKIDIKIKDDDHHDKQQEQQQQQPDDCSTTIAAVSINDQKVCEIKRLYVKSEFRGLKIGKLLTEKLIQDAKELNYNYMILDTLKSLTTAISLYKGLGFIEMEPYYFNPNGDKVAFLKLKL